MEPRDNGTTFHNNDQIDILHDLNLIPLEKVRANRRLEEMQFQDTIRNAYGTLRQERIQNQNDDHHNGEIVALFAKTTDPRQTVVNTGQGLDFMRGKYLNELINGARMNNITYIDTLNQNNQAESAA